MKTSPITFLAAVCLLPVLLAFCGGTPLAIGRQVPAFRLDTFRHERFYLEDYRKKTVILVFWATWCRACKKEMAAIENFRHDPRFRDVVFAAVCTDPENASDIEPIIAGLGISFPVLMDAGARLYRRFAIQALPFTMLIRPGGRLAFMRTGYDGTLLPALEAIFLTSGTK